MDILLYILLFLVLGIGGFLGYMYLQAHLGGEGAGRSLFGPKPEKRIDVVEHWNLDARRRLVLVRRDDVEHLIMTGGPVDVVIETGIRDGRKPAHPDAPPSRWSRSGTFSSNGSSGGAGPATGSSVTAPKE